MMRNSLLSLLISVLSLALTGGCTDDLRVRSVFDDGIVDAVVSFSVENISLTRTDTDQSFESLVDHAYLLFYPAGVSLAGSVPLAAVRAEADLKNGSALTFKMPLRLSPDTDYQLLALANADGYADDGFNNYGEYLDSWCDRMSGEKVPLLISRPDRILMEEGGLLPMRGTSANGSTIRFSLKNGKYELSSSLRFRRMVARIDVANIIKQGFTIEGVALCNWRDAVSSVDSGSMSGNRYGTVRGILSVDGEPSDDSIFCDMPSADDAGIQQLNGLFYCFPSVCYESHESDTESTALIIKARYQDDAESSYYRVNVAMSGGKSEVKENTKYLLTIQSVKGRGAKTVEEAYAAEGSPIVLSVVEGWDLDGSFATDDDGNFLVLSVGRLEFEADEASNREVKVLSSKGLSWSVEYIPDDEAWADAFKYAVLSDTSIALGPTGENTDTQPRSGIFRVSSFTSGSSSLSVDIAAVQKAAAEKPYVPVIPTDLPLALIPMSDERVRIDHEALTIEIDGFDPDCFNSFIDVPFSVYVNEDAAADGAVYVSTDMQAPLEGCVSKQKRDDYFYCSNSFVTSGTSAGSVYSKSNGKELTRFQAFGAGAISTSGSETVYISVGAMAPDDPKIVRTVSLSTGNHIVKYTLTVRPRPTIIDDVVLSDNSGFWLIQDRNIQNIDYSAYKTYIGRKSDGLKYQAYNFTSQDPSTAFIPGKFIDEKGTSFDEKKHGLYSGKDIKYTSRNTLEPSMRRTWLANYVYSEGQERTSPFYEADGIDEWKYPSQAVLDLCVERMKVSKMRMFLVSDFSAKSGKDLIPICCYWPYWGDVMDKLTTFDYTFGYYFADSSGIPISMKFIYCDKDEIKAEFSTSSLDKCYGLSRLVRQLSRVELDNYKNEFLGYGSLTLRLVKCHPDTYESVSLGWIPL